MRAYKQTYHIEMVFPVDVKCPRRWDFWIVTHTDRILRFFVAILRLVLVNGWVG